MNGLTVEIWHPVSTSHHEIKCLMKTLSVNNEKQIPTCAIRVGRKKPFIIRNKYLPVSVLLGLAGKDSSSWETNTYLCYWGWHEEIFHYEKQIPTCAIRVGRKRLFIMRNKYLPVLLGLARKDSSSWETNTYLCYWGWQEEIFHYEKQIPTCAIRVSRKRLSL